MYVTSASKKEILIFLGQQKLKVPFEAHFRELYTQLIHFKTLQEHVYSEFG